MNRWIENRVEELTEQRRAELAEYFDEHEWAGDFGEAEYPEYFEDIKAFFEPYIQEYDEAFQKVHDSALKEYVTYSIEQEAECIRERAEEEYADLEGDEMD